MTYSCAQLQRPVAAERDRVNILLVDDQPSKILTLETILAPLDETTIRANSAEEALGLLLAMDVAVVLVDVCMPRMDGFELAELIRGHPRFRRTAIIFISAVHFTDEDRVKGYDLGAVDYIPVPIVPALLRAKVAVFADLYRKTDQLHRLNQELERRVAERTADLQASNARLRESEARFQQIAQTIDQVFWLAEGPPNARFLYISPAWERIWGRSSRLVREDPRAWLETVHADDRRVFAAVLDAMFQNSGEGAWDTEYRIVRPGGEVRWIRDRGQLLRGAGGESRSAGLAEDVTSRKEAEAVLQRDRDTLEQLVAERTAELERSNERVRLSDRMATIGTLSAGLGHDLGNLLLPIRMRLDAIESRQMPDDIREDISAIRTASTYLQRVASGLRLLALDPDVRPVDEDAPTEIGSWWKEVAGMLRNGLPSSVDLAGEIEPALPPVSLSKPALAQMVFNLVQNAGDSLKGRPAGRVVVRAARRAADTVVISVEDNGPGMSADVRRRCMEPFFTTKTRGLSTGLGLTLVSALARRAGGALEIESGSGKGTCVRFTLPVQPTPAMVLEHRPATPTGPKAVVRIGDPGLAAHVRALLGSLGFELHDHGASVEFEVLVTDEVERRRRREPSHPLPYGAPRRIVVLGAVEPAEADGGLLVVPTDCPRSVLLQRLRSCLVKSLPESEPST